MQLCEQVEVVAGDRGWHAETFALAPGVGQLPSLMPHS